KITSPNQSVSAITGSNAGNTRTTLWNQLSSNLSKPEYLLININDTQLPSRYPTFAFQVLPFYKYPLRKDISYETYILPVDSSHLEFHLLMSFFLSAHLDLDAGQKTAIPVCMDAFDIQPNFLSVQVRQYYPSTLQQHQY